MLANKRIFDGLRFCLNFAYTCRAHGATRMWFSEGLSAVCHKMTTIDVPAKMILARSQAM